MKWLLRECGGQEKLTSFLENLIRSRKEVDGTALDGSRLGEKWDFYGAHGQNLCFNGDWVVKHHGRNRTFEIWWTYEQTETKAVIVTLRIRTKGKLDVVSIVNETDIVVLTP